MAKNKVIEGLYKGQSMDSIGSCMLIGSVVIKKSQIESYEILTSETHKSGASMIIRGALGMAVLGSIGALAALTAKDSATYLVSIKWNKDFLRSKGLPDDSKSLIEIDENIYKALVQTMF